MSAHRRWSPRRRFLSFHRGSQIDSDSRAAANEIVAYLFHNTFGVEGSPEEAEPGSSPMLSSGTKSSVGLPGRIPGGKGQPATGRSRPMRD
jgi:hypothetical protein